MESPKHANKVHLNILKKLGSGKFEVFHTRMLPSYEEYALKAFPKDPASHEVFQRESKFLSKLNHENIIRHVPIKNFTQENMNMNCDYILTEYAPYGTFFDLVSNKGLINDKIIRTYFHQMINGIEYLHSQGIAHLDLKLENLLLGNDFMLKIADFDQSQNVRENKLLYFGTSCYRAPEVWTNTCRDFYAADIYSLGVLLFIFKAGCFPFMETEEGACKNLVHYDLFNEDNEEFWQLKVADRRNKGYFDESFKELLNGMLTSDSSKRWTIEDIKSSKWFNGPVLEGEQFKVEMEKVWERITFRKYVKK